MQSFPCVSYTEIQNLHYVDQFTQPNPTCQECKLSGFTYLTACGMGGGMASSSNQLPAPAMLAGKFPCLAGLGIRLTKIGSNRLACLEFWTHHPQMPSLYRLLTVNFLHCSVLFALISLNHTLDRVWIKTGPHILKAKPTDNPVNVNPAVGLQTLSPLSVQASILEETSCYLYSPFEHSYSDAKL